MNKIKYNAFSVDGFLDFYYLIVRGTFFITSTSSLTFLIPPEILRHIPRARFSVNVQVIHLSVLSVPLLRPLARRLR